MTSERVAQENARSVFGAAPLVLVIEDDPSVRSMLETALPRYGLRTLVAADGREAVQLYRERGAEVAVVLSDVGLPDLDGPAVLAALQALNPNVRLCFMTGNSGGYTATELFAAGAICVFAKPFVLADLVFSLRAILPPG